MKKVSELARHVTVINQTLARDYFRNEDPIGGRIKFVTFEQWAADWPRDAYFEIIGVIADAKNTGLQEAPRPEVYFPHSVSGTGPQDHGEDSGKLKFDSGKPSPRDSDCGSRCGRL